MVRSDQGNEWMETLSCSCITLHSITRCYPRYHIGVELFVHDATATYTVTLVPERGELFTSKQALHYLEA
jgi:hypothetical protein